MRLITPNISVENDLLPVFLLQKWFAANLFCGISFAKNIDRLPKTTFSVCLFLLAFICRQKLDLLRMPSYFEANRLYALLTLVKVSMCRLDLIISRHPTRWQLSTLHFHRRINSDQNLVNQLLGWITSRGIQRLDDPIKFEFLFDNGCVLTALLWAVLWPTIDQHWEARFRVLWGELTRNWGELTMESIGNRWCSRSSSSAQPVLEALQPYRGLNQGIKCRELEMCPRPKMAGIATKVCPLRQTFEPCDHGLGPCVTHKYWFCWFCWSVSTLNSSVRCQVSVSEMT